MKKADWPTRVAELLPAMVPAIDAGRRSRPWAVTLPPVIVSASAIYAVRAMSWTSSGMPDTVKVHEK
jgi:hypothetical protein